jgi:predicted TIM-barrel fold metal-dependent hydrolase
LATLEQVASPMGIGHFVLVQPSIYGNDNTQLLRALEEGQGRHRGVVVVDTTMQSNVLQDMAQLGVRGVRCNRVSPVGNSPAALQCLAPRLRELGWHVQWYVQGAQLAEVARFQHQHGLTCVLDHLAGLRPGMSVDSEEGVALRRIADGGGWIKLSGWYRLGAAAPYGELDPNVRLVASWFGERCIWGSDWPHTMFLEAAHHGPAPHYADTWQPVPRGLGDSAATRILNQHPLPLYR